MDERSADTITSGEPLSQQILATLPDCYSCIGPLMGLFPPSSYRDGESPVDMLLHSVAGIAQRVNGYFSEERMGMNAIRNRMISSKTMQTLAYGLWAGYVDGLELINRFLDEEGRPLALFSKVLERFAATDDKSIDMDRLGALNTLFATMTKGSRDKALSHYGAELSPLLAGRELVVVGQLYDDSIPFADGIVAPYSEPLHLRDDLLRALLPFRGSVVLTTASRARRFVDADE